MLRAVFLGHKIKMRITYFTSYCFKAIFSNMSKEDFFYWLISLKSFILELLHLNPEIF